MFFVLGMALARRGGWCGWAEPSACFTFLADLWNAALEAEQVSARGRGENHYGTNLTSPRPNCSQQGRALPISRVSPIPSLTQTDLNESPKFNVLELRSAPP